MTADIQIKQITISSYAEGRDVIGAFLSETIDFEITSAGRTVPFQSKFQNVPNPNQAVQSGLLDLEHFVKDLQSALAAAQNRYRYGV